MALSSMMQHYLTIKEKYPDCIIFYRLGDFYEMFFDDAVKASKLLDLTLTGRDCGLEERAPMCGVPFHAADNYIAKLVEQGEKVAICEQLEEASKAKGIVHRDVIRVVTAGTVIEDAQLDEKSNNFICCAMMDLNLVGLAWADITTGELCATEFGGDDAVKKAIAYMLKLSVKEVICDDTFLLSSKDSIEVTRGLLPHFSCYPAWAFRESAATKTLQDQLQVKTLSAFSISGHLCAIGACGALVEYLKSTQKHALQNIDSIQYVQQDRYLQLDPTAVRNLELVKNISENKKYGSLLWLLDKTKTPMGARLLSNFILSPLYDENKIRYRLSGVSELYNASVIRIALGELLHEVYDIERLAGKISNNNIMPKDCLALARSLAVLPNIKFQLAGFTSNILQDISSALIDLSDVTQMLKNAISEEPPATLKDGGYIKAGYNAELDQLRNVKTNATDLLLNLEAKERDRTDIKNLRIKYNRVFGYYIEITKSFLDRVPVDYERRQTLANAERYSTPELKQLEEKILTSEDLQLKLESDLYNEIKSVLLRNIGNLKKISGAIALLDVICSYAEVSKNNRYVQPEIVSSGEPLVIKEGRHPVVEVISKDRFISNDIMLDESENRTMILTGPNMAGKSTYMRQTAIIVIMAHIGCFVPAKVAQIPLIDRIFTRVGASDNLIFDQSTFMVEMIEVASILQNATKDSLLILDEVGRGTSTYDGLSIAWAVTEHLTNEIGAKTMFATHYHELTELENRISGIKNYKIAVKEMNGSVVFLRKIMRGGANRSFGIEVASLAGVPQVVTNRAKAILKSILKQNSKSVSEIESFDDAENEEKISEVEKILMETDVNQLSPMQAFMLVTDLVEKVKRK